MHRTLVAAPAILMALIGFQSRTSNPEFDFVSPTPAQNAKITAYREAVGKVAALGPEREGTSAVDIRRVAAVWIEGARAGKLSPMVPAAYEDTSRDGVKGTIVRANLDLTERLADVAWSELSRQGYVEAAHDAALAVEVGSVTKQSDFSSVVIMGMGQRRALTVLKEALPKVPLAEREAIVLRLMSQKLSPETLSKLAAQARRQFQAYQLSQEQEPVSIADVARVLSPDDIERFETNTRTETRHHSAFLASTQSDPELLSEVRVGCLSAFETNRRIDEAIQAAKL